MNLIFIGLVPEKGMLTKSLCTLFSDSGPIPSIMATLPMLLWGLRLVFPFCSLWSAAGEEVDHDFRILEFLQEGL